MTMVSELTMQMTFFTGSALVGAWAKIPNGTTKLAAAKNAVLMLCFFMGINFVSMKQI